jgi:hypothetical protein
MHILRLQISAPMVQIKKAALKAAFVPYQLDLSNFLGDYRLVSLLDFHRL